jgi:Flp pilus assembly protein TadD
MFTATGVVVRLFHDRQAQIAADWKKAGDINLQTGHAQTAIEDFRNALLYSPDNSQLQLDLAEALATQGKFEEATTYLFNLRAVDPENSLIDLELARISARQGDLDAAVGFYHDAAFGLWPDHTHDRRVATRKELIAFLLQHHRNDQARAEALSLAADNPVDPDTDTASAEFLLQSEDTQGALAEYQHALDLAPTNLEALVGAAQAAQELRDFSKADLYLARAIQHGDREAGAVADLARDSTAAEIDPFDTRLSNSERARRVIEIFNDANLRAKTCMMPEPRNPSKAWDDLKALVSARAALPAKLTEAELKDNPDLANQALRWSFSVELAADAQCAPSLNDRAIEALAAKADPAGK